MTAPGSPAAAARRAAWLGATVIALGVIAAYANSFRGVFVLDDLGAIHDNPSIRSLATAFFPPAGGTTVGGRPLLNFTFALNYALGGESTAGYHAVNLIIHLLASLTLFGVVRRTLRAPAVSSAVAEGADGLAAAIALLWALHPLQTESVTYVVQRAESLAGLLYLTTLYAFIRGTSAGASPRWLDVCIAAALLGALTKETIVTAPVMILLYDRLFVSRSWAEALDRHRGVYYGLALSWLVVWWQLVGTGGRGGTAGFDTSVTWTAYGLKQLEAVALYVKLTFWPLGQVLDYGTNVTVSPGRIATGLAGLAGLLAVAIAAARRQPALGFLGAWFFVCLAPTTSIVPVATQVMAEHRMYLPLAAAAAAVVLGLQALVGKWAPWIALGLAVSCGILTFQRNRDYTSWITLWSQAVAFDDNPRAHLNLGQALAESGHPAEAIEQYAAALRREPRNGSAHNNWANALVDLGRVDEACGHYVEALRLRPGYPEAHFNYGNTLLRLGRLQEAVEHYRSAIRLAPGHARAHYGLAIALTRAGLLDAALEEYLTAARLAPANAEFRLQLGNALLHLDRPAEAVPEFEAALRLDPSLDAAARALAAARQAAGHR